MSSINGLPPLGGSSGLPPLNGVNGTSRLNGKGLSSARGSDSVELSGSGVSEYLKILKGNDVRPDKVASVKAAIESGSYESDHKLDIAVDRLLDDLNA